MNKKYSPGDYSLFSIIVDSGKASGLLEYCKEQGVTGGSIIPGVGAAKSGFLRFLELGYQEKEILIMILRSELEDRLHDALEKDIVLNKKNHGIAFSMNVFRMMGSHIDEVGDKMIENHEISDYEAVFVIVEMGDGDDVILAAQEAGAKGATIIHGRGSGIHEKAHLFGLVIEPEKEIVLMLIKRESVEEVMNSVKKSIDIDKPGKGIMFALDVNRTTGLAE